MDVPYSFVAGMPLRYPSSTSKAVASKANGRFGASSLRIEKRFRNIRTKVESCHRKSEMSALATFFN